MEAASVPQILDKLEKLPSMPAVMQKIIDSFDGPNLEADKLASEISQDQGLATRVLRIANSSFYGLSRQVASIQDAVVVLGFSNIRSLALAAGFVHSFPHTSPGLFDGKAFWRHSLRVAVCARALAKCCRQNAQTAFTAGLLHDIGQAVLDDCLHDSFNAVLERLNREGGDLYALEREMLGFDHAAIGTEMARRWNFPVSIQHVIQYHHLAGQETDETLTGMIHLADLLADRLGTGMNEHDIFASLPPELCARLEISPETFRHCLPEVEQMVAGADLLLEG